MKNSIFVVLLFVAYCTQSFADNIEHHKLQDKTQETSHGKAQNQTSQISLHESDGVAPEKALSWLKEGNDRFVRGSLTHDNQSSKRRSELSSGQKPFAILLSCSDSRVPPEVLFDKGLGELFVVRVAGNALSAAGVASIEYAIEHLGARLIVVMGHESCGAVKAALNTPASQTAGSPDLDTLVSEIQHSFEYHGQRSIASQNAPQNDPTLREPVIKNVDYVSDRLVQRSSIVRKKVKEGQVKIVRAIYGLSSGHVDFWGEK